MLRKIISTLAVIVGIISCDNSTHSSEDQPQQQPDAPAKAVFVKGADISWLTQMESDGQKFYSQDGKEMECTALMKSVGFDAIRLRVWVDPEDGWSGRDDVLVKARRAQENGMRIMIDFHYSDSWADPGKQNPPAGWKNHDITELRKALQKHTEDMLCTLKDNGIDVEWVQIGNEVNNGMLWPLGKVEGKTASNFIGLINAGYDIVKKIYPSAKVIIHVSNGHDAGLFDWFFGLMKSGNARYDIIGMSLYPTWWENGGWSDWKSNVDKCISNIKSISTKYDKPVILCEIGMPVSEPQMSKEAIGYILGETRKIETCHGVFYWEPQTDGIWKPSSYNALGWNAYNMGAFKNGKPTIALDPFKD